MSDNPMSSTRMRTTFGRSIEAFRNRPGRIIHEARATGYRGGTASRPNTRTPLVFHRSGAEDSGLVDRHAGVMPSTNRTVRFGVFGCGRIGRMHARNIAANRRAELVACYDVVADAAAAMAADLGCRAAQAIDDLLADAAIDAIFIASTTDTHVELITAGVNARKAVLCEKPIDLDIALVDACWREIGPLDPLLMIVFNRRFDPEFRALKERIDAGAVGRIEQVFITNRDPAP